MDWLLQRMRALARALGPGGTFALRVSMGLLVPGGGPLLSLLEGLLELGLDKASQEDERQLLQELQGMGEELDRLNQVLDLVEGQLQPILRTASVLEPQAIENHLATALARDPELLSIRKQLFEICSGTGLLREGQQEILARVDAGVDVVQDLRELIDGTLVYFRAAEAEGVSAAQAPVFVLAQRDFLAAVRGAELADAHAALQRIEALAPESATAWLYRAGLAALEGRVDEAAHDAATAARRDPSSRVLRKVTRAASRATRARLPPAEAALLEPGKVLGSKRWKLGRLLGQGGQGQVWHAHNARGQSGAVKVLRGTSESPRLIGEMEALELVQHPSVIELLDWGLEPMPFLVCRYVKGASLSTRLRRDGPLSPPEACRVFTELAQGLAACHKVGLVHRDIKPDNILLDERGSPVLIDFGIARQTRSSDTTELNPHTMAFAAPEQLRGLPATSASDVFSLAATLAYAMAPAEGLPMDIIEELPEDFQQLLEPALHPAARKRQASASDFAAGLKALHARRLGAELKRERQAQAELKRTQQEAERRAQQALRSAEQAERQALERAKHRRLEQAEHERLQTVEQARLAETSMQRELDALRLETARREAEEEDLAAHEAVLARNFEDVDRWEAAADVNEVREELGLAPMDDSGKVVAFIASAVVVGFGLLLVLGSC